MNLYNLKSDDRIAGKSRFLEGLWSLIAKCNAMYIFLIHMTQS
jgi:hypothetical protein